MTVSIELFVPDLQCDKIEFVVNGKQADIDDFGYMDYGDDAPDFGCASRHFRSQPAGEFVLEKYGLTAEQYETVIERLNGDCWFSSCGWCS